MREKMRIFFNKYRIGLGRLISFSFLACRLYMFTYRFYFSTLFHENDKVKK